MNQAAIRQITHTAVSDRVLVAKEELFTRKMSGTYMYFFLEGSLSYRRDRRKVKCVPGMWVSEAAVWIEGFQHRGVLTAQMHCEVVCLHAETFRKFVRKFMKSCQPHVKVLASFNAQYAVRFLSGADDSEDEDPMLQWTDIWFDASRISCVVESIINENERQAVFNKKEPGSALSSLSVRRAVSRISSRFSHRAGAQNEDMRV